MSNYMSFIVKPSIHAAMWCMIHHKTAGYVYVTPNGMIMWAPTKPDVTPEVDAWEQVEDEEIIYQHTPHSGWMNTCTDVGTLYAAAAMSVQDVALEAADCVKRNAVHQADMFDK